MKNMTFRSAMVCTDVQEELATIFKVAEYTKQQTTK
jgi:hypothetical protein